MAEYINRETLIARINGTGYHEQIKSNFLFIARILPAADVASVRHGRWIDLRESSKDVPKSACSVCNNEIIGLETTYCPNCGAKMDGETLYRIPPSYIDDAPTVDAVEVVRCRDCKYYDKECGYCEAMGFNCKYDDFCSYGERRTDE